MLLPISRTTTSKASIQSILQQFVTIPSLALFAPAIVATAQNLDDFNNPPTLAKDYFGFQVLHQIVLTHTMYGQNARALNTLMADMLARLLEGELEPMKYCRLRHLGERHVLVVEAFINSLQAGGEAQEDFADLTMMRKGVRAGVSILEALYLQTWERTFWIGWRVWV